MNKLMLSAVLRVVTRSLPCLTMALGAATGPAAAQTAPAPAAPARDEPVELSPFIIATERDTGWSANDTLSANRTKQALKDVPVNIDAITRDFMEDLGLDSADDVALFVANVYALPIMENDNHKGNFSFRGLAQTNNVSRNYFRWYIPSDTYNVERIDFGKGSNSLIFGEVEPGGQGAVFTKRPLLRNFGEFYGQYTNEGAYRFQLDVNRRLRPDLALRFNAVRRLQRTFQDASITGSAARRSPWPGSRSGAPASASNSSKAPMRTSVVSPGSGCGRTPRAAALSARPAPTTPRTASGSSPRRFPSPTARLP